MSDRKLWKVISIGGEHGSRISRSMSYGDCIARYTEYRKNLKEGDVLYMIQVLEVAVGQATIPLSGFEEIDITGDPDWLRQQAGVGG